MRTTTTRMRGIQNTKNDFTLFVPPSTLFLSPKLYSLSKRRERIKTEVSAMRFGSRSLKRYMRLRQKPVIYCNSNGLTENGLVVSIITKLTPSNVSRLKPHEQPCNTNPLPELPLHIISATFPIPQQLRAENQKGPSLHQTSQLVRCPISNPL